MKQLSVNSEGNTNEELVDALEEVLRLLKEGFTSGNNSNGCGSFNFIVLGEDEKEEPIIEYIDADDAEDE